MPRKVRFYQSGLPVHVFQRGHNRGPVFFTDEDYLCYLRCLKSAADDSGCLIHAYVLMTNHVHLLVTPETSSSISDLFKLMGIRYVMYINKAYNLRGSLWEGRHKGCLIDTDDYFLMCMRYIEMNPVRADMVDHPGQYRWSSYAANASGVDNVIIKPHLQYLMLGDSPESRQLTYTGFFGLQLDSHELDLIRASLHSGTPMGNENFKQKIEAAVGCKLGGIRPGRPAKT